jgi:hypothetical protein
VSGAEKRLGKSSLADTNEASDCDDLSFAKHKGEGSRTGGEL